MIAGHYRLVEHIGSGAMGVVWRAVDERLERSVAVKQILTQPGLSEAERDNVRQRAMREAKNAARFQHPNAIVVFDIAEHAGDPCLVMEYLPSKSLSAILAERPTLPLREVAAIGRQVAAALVAAHRAGLVHRDVKPGNVLIDDNGTAKITDFGISRAAGDLTLTQTGLIGGTPAYLAPELARGADPAPSSDVFALGATLYHAIEGQTPYGNSTNQLALLYSAANGKIIPPANAGPATALLMSLLRTEPEERPSMAEARDRLAALAAGGDGASTNGSQAPSPTLVSPPLAHAGRKPAAPAPTPPPTAAAAHPPWKRTEKPAAAPPPTSTFASASSAPAPAKQSGGSPLKRKPLLIGGIAAVVVALATVLTIVLLQNGNQNPNDPNQAQPGGNTAESNAPNSPSDSPSAPPKLGETPSAGEVDFGTAARYLLGYLTAVSNGNSEAWDMLTPAAQQVYRSQDAFAEYWPRNELNYWGGGAQQAGDATGGAVNVSYELRYKSDSAERLPFRIIKSADGKLLIDSDTRRPADRNTGN